MKKAKLSTLLIFLFLILTEGYSQQLVKDGAQWNIKSGSMITPNYSSHSLKIEGDTTIDNILYKKMFISYDSLNMSWIEAGKYLREDDMKRVYAKIGLEDEILLYDFSLLEGDTFNIQGFCDIFVTEVDSIEIDNGEIRRRLKVKDLDNQYPVETYWIEGIGSAEGLFANASFHCGTDHLEALLCHYDNAGLTYQHNPNGCFLVSSIEEIEKFNGIEIYPNPTEKEFTIELNEKNLRVDNISIFSSEGIFLELRKLDNEDMESIDISTYPPGMYILLLQLHTGELIPKKITKL